MRFVDEAELEERLLPDDERLLAAEERLLPDDERLLAAEERLLPDLARLLPDLARLLPDLARLLPDDDLLRELAEERLRPDADRLPEARLPDDRLPDPLLDERLLDDLRLDPLAFFLPPEPPLLRRSAILAPSPDPHDVVFCSYPWVWTIPPRSGR